MSTSFKLTLETITQLLTVWENLRANRIKEFVQKVQVPVQRLP